MLVASAGSLACNNNNNNNNNSNKNNNHHHNNNHHNNKTITTGLIGSTKYTPSAKQYHSGITTSVVLPHLVLVRQRLSK